MRVLILGSTGLVGNEVLKKLVENKSVESITTITRSKVEIENEKIKQVVLPLDQWFTDSNNFKDIDVAISSFGTTRAAAGGIDNFKRIDYGTNLDFAKACKSQEVSKFILVSTGMANPNSMFPYLRIKGELERDIEALGFDDYFFLRPGGLIGKRKPGKSKGFGEGLMQKLGVHWPFSLAIRPTKVEIIADYINLLISKEGKKVCEYDDIMNSKV